MKRSLLFAPIVISLLQGCINTPVQKISDTLVRPSMSLPVLAPPRTVLLQAQEKVDGYKDAVNGKVYNLTLKDAELKDVLALLSRDSAMPIVAEREVEGKVSVNVEGKKLGDVLYTVLKPLGYTAFIENGVVVVGRPKLVTKTFFVNYIKDKRSSSSSMNASVSAGGGSAGTSTSSTGGNTSTDSSLSSGSSSSSGGAVNVTTSGTSDFWDEISKGLEAIVFGGAARNEKSGKKLVINRMAGVIYVTDYSDNMGNISSFLNDVEKALKRQVLIQAHIVEVGLSDKFSLGLDWRTIIDKSTNFGISQALAPVPNSNVFKISASGDNFGFLMDAMREQGHVNMLSSPRISTMNNQRAVIKLTTREVTWVNSTILNAQGNTLQTYTTPQVDEVGLFLDVTPNIDETGVITMQIHPSISELTRVSVSPDGKSSKPVIDIREVDTMVDVRSGQSIVIAGLIVDKLKETKRSVPVLGEIPYVGAAFSNVSQEKVKTELVIFLTPFVLNEKSIEDIRREHEARLLQLDESFQAINSLNPPPRGRQPAASPVSFREDAPVPVPIVPKKAAEETMSSTIPAPPVRPPAVSAAPTVPKSAPAPASPVAGTAAAVPVAPNPAASATQPVSVPDEGEKNLYRQAMSSYREPGDCRQALQMFDRFLATYPASLYAGFIREYRQDCQSRLAAR